ncbi:hypothetical protein D3C87_1878950 [compost metagenome]
MFVDGFVQHIKIRTVQADHHRKSALAALVGKDAELDLARLFRQLREHARQLAQRRLGVRVQHAPQRVLIVLFRHRASIADKRAARHHACAGIRANSLSSVSG